MGLLLMLAFAAGAGFCAGRIRADKVLPGRIREKIAREIESVVADWPDESHGHSPAEDGQWIADFFRASEFMKGTR